MESLDWWNQTLQDDVNIKSIQEEYDLGIGDVMDIFMAILVAIMDSKASPAVRATANKLYTAIETEE